MTNNAPSLPVRCSILRSCWSCFCLCACFRSFLFLVCLVVFVGLSGNPVGTNQTDRRSSTKRKKGKEKRNQLNRDKRTQHSYTDTAPSYSFPRLSALCAIGVDPPPNPTTVKSIHARDQRYSYSIQAKAPNHTRHGATNK